MIKFPIAVIIMVIVAELTAGVWFKETDTTDHEQLVFTPVIDSDSSVAFPLDESRVGELLSFSRGTSVQSKFIDDDPAKSLTTIVLEYDPGNGRLWRDLFGHSPDICMPSSGARFVEGSRELLPLPSFKGARLARFEFTHPIEEGPIFVYKLVWLGSGDWQDEKIPDFDSWAMRWDFIAQRRSTPAATLLLTMAVGFPSSSESDAAVKSFVLANCKIRP